MVALIYQRKDDTIEAALARNIQPAKVAGIEGNSLRYHGTGWGENSVFADPRQQRWRYNFAGVTVRSMRLTRR
jgi:hypothetical protein